MKQTSIILLALLGLIFSSCKEEMLIGDKSYPFTFAITIEDREGHNLLDSETAGAIDIEALSMTMNGETYQAVYGLPEKPVFDDLMFDFYGAFITDDSEYGVVLMFGTIDFYGSMGISKDQDYFINIGEESFVFSTIYVPVKISSQLITDKLNPQDSKYKISVRSAYPIERFYYDDFKTEIKQ